MTGKVRKPYEKPGIKEIRLVPEEAVLENCKVNSGDLGPGSICGTGVDCKISGAIS